MCWIIADHPALPRQHDLDGADRTNQGYVCTYILNGDLILSDGRRATIEVYRFCSEAPHFRSSVLHPHAGFGANQKCHPIEKTTT